MDILQSCMKPSKCTHPSHASFETCRYHVCWNHGNGETIWGGHQEPPVRTLTVISLGVIELMGMGFLAEIYFLVCLYWLAKHKSVAPSTFSDQVMAKQTRYHIIIFTPNPGGALLQWLVGRDPLTQKSMGAEKGGQNFMSGQQNRGLKCILVEYCKREV